MGKEILMLGIGSLVRVAAMSSQSCQGLARSARDLIFLGYGFQPSGGQDIHTILRLCGSQPSSAFRDISNEKRHAP